MLVSSPPAFAVVISTGSCSLFHSYFPQRKISSRSSSVRFLKSRKKSCFAPKIHFEREICFECSSSVLEPTGDSSELRQRFFEEVTKPDADIDLGIASALVSCMTECRDLDVSTVSSALDDLAKEVAKRLLDAPPYPLRVIQTIKNFLDEQGFEGDKDHFYYPRAALINEVLTTKKGMTVTLCIVWLEIARRIGFPMTAVDIPHHILLRPDFSESEFPELDIFVDPFCQGEVLFRDDCYQLISSIHDIPIDDPRLKDEKHFKKVSNKDVLLRLLRHLKEIYLYLKEEDKAYSITEMLALMNSMHPTDHRDYGKILYARQQWASAEAELAIYLALRPNAEDFHLIHEMLRDIKGNCKGS